MVFLIFIFFLYCVEVASKSLAILYECRKCTDNTLQCQTTSRLKKKVVGSDQTQELTPLRN